MLLLKKYYDQNWEKKFQKYVISPGFIDIPDQETTINNSLFQNYLVLSPNLPKGTRNF